MVMRGVMEMEERRGETAIHYFSNFNLFGPSQILTLCQYRAFNEKVIQRLGEDWRIQSNLLAQEIVDLRKVSHPQQDFYQFNIFNQFLQAFLKGKIGKQFEASILTESAMQEYFVNELESKFTEEAIHTGIPFKTLTLGYFMIGTQVWRQIFRDPPPPYKKKTQIVAFATRYHMDKAVPKSMDESNMDVSSVRRKVQQIDIQSFSEYDNYVQKKGKQRNITVRWGAPQLQAFSEKQLKSLETTVKLIPHEKTKTQVLSYYVCYVDQIRTKSHQRIRTFSLSNDFYAPVFIIWVIFNVKMFFQLSFSDYQRHVKTLLHDQWKQEYDRPLKKFQILLQRQWNKLLKDYTIDLHDDEKILKILIDHMQKEIQKDWQQKLSFLKQNISIL